MRNLRGVFRSALLLILACLVPGAARADEKAELPRGQVIPSVVCEGDARQSYALYLPSNYSSDRAWPILFAFDPMARGEVPVKLFAEAAENYGYIVAGSNNSRNGPVRDEMVAMQAMYADALQRLSFDRSRVYTAGFSGGARVASRMGLMLAGVRGVVAVGGGFPHGTKPGKETSFALFGVAGLADFNYGEVMQLVKDFESLGLPSHFEVLESGHNWPPQEVCTAALEWFEVLWLRDARGEKDSGLAQRIFEKRLRQAENEAAKGNLARAFERYEAILRDFTDLVDISKASEQVERLKSSKDLAAAQKLAEKREKKRELLDARAQERLTRVLAHIYSSLFSAGEAGAPPNLPETGGAFNPATGSPGTTRPPMDGFISGSDALAFEKLVAGLDLRGLRKTLEKKKGTDEALVAERQLQRVFVSTLETARNMEHLEKHRQALMCLEVAEKAAPENGFVQFSLARVLALAGHKDRSLKALEAAAEKGFARDELVEQDEALHSIRSEERYQAVLQKMRAAKAAAPGAP